MDKENIVAIPSGSVLTKEQTDALYEFAKIPIPISVDEWKRLGYTDEESQELFEASKIPATISDDVDISGINMKEIERIADEFSHFGCTSFRLTPEELRKILEEQENV